MSEGDRVTLDGMGIPPHIISAGGTAGFDVRATRLRLPRHQLRAELWVGGGYTAFGQPVAVGDLRDAWVIDCAGELPSEFATHARLFISRVFEDIEQEPPAYAEIVRLAERMGAAIRGTPRASGDGGPPPPSPPDRVYVMCKQGLNRSALVAGRILRALGIEGDEAVRTLRAQRPGTLANLAFEQLLRR